MSKNIYIGDGIATKKIKKIYMGDGTTTRKVKKIYIGDENGKAKLCYVSAFEISQNTGTLSGSLEKDWEITFKNSGSITFKSVPGPIDIFLVGGGGGAGGNNYNHGVGGGAGGGYTKTFFNVRLQENLSYQIIVGAGGSGGGQYNELNNHLNHKGGTSFFKGGNINYSAEGGDASRGPNSSDTYCANGGPGGSGGGGAVEGHGGSNGSNGTTGRGTSGGKGQGTTTRAFGETNGTLYGGGGAGGSDNGRINGGAGGGGNATSPGATNTGGGGGGGCYNWGDGGRNGGSGIVIIRNHRE